jgi:hypothetical protein
MILQQSATWPFASYALTDAIHSATLAMVEMETQQFKTSPIFFCKIKTTKKFLLHVMSVSEPSLFPSLTS